MPGHHARENHPGVNSPDVWTSVAGDERLRQLLDSMPAAVCTCDSAGHITFFNRRAAELWGREPRLHVPEERFCGSFRMWTLDGRLLSREQSPMADAITHGRKARNFEVVIEQPTGNRIVANLDIDPVYDASGRLTGAVNVFTDITTSKWTQGALLENEARFQDATESVEALLRNRTPQISTLLTRLIAAHEQERRRIAHEIHDRLGQQITALRMSLEVLEEKGHRDPAVAQHAQHTQRLAEQLDETIDLLTWQLRSATLDHLGLSAALQNLAADWSQRFGVPISRDLSGVNGDRFPWDVEVHLYRIVQEALDNVARHAHATQVAISLVRNDSELVLTVEDNGCGFSEGQPSEGRQSKSFGIMNMRAHATLAGGHLDIESRPGSGTTLFVRVPVQGI